MQVIRQGMQIKVRIGVFVDVGDGFTPETGVTLGAADEAELLKANGAGTVSIAASTWAAIADCDGWYDLTLSTDDTDTLGMLSVVVHDDDVCLPVHVHFMVVTANVWDSKYSTDKLEVDVTQIGGSTQSATDIKDYADNGYDPSTHKVEACKANDDMRGTDNAALAASWTATRAGYVDKLNVSGTLAHSDAASTYKADVSGLSTFDAGTDKVYLANGAHGGAAATLTLVSYANFKADVSALALEANVETHVVAGLGTYDPPTKAELENAVASLAVEANVEGHVTTALTAYDPPTKAELDNAVSTLAVEANVAAHAATGAAAAIASYDPPTYTEMAGGFAALPSASTIVSTLLGTSSITADGAATFQEILVALYAGARGKVVKSGDAYTYYDDDDTTAAFTLTIAASARTVS